MGGAGNIKILEMRQRRDKIAALLMKRYKPEEIAAELNLNRGMVLRETALILKEWQKRNNETTDQYVSEALARLDAAEEAIWPNVMNGTARAIEVWLQLFEKRAHLLGLFNRNLKPDDFGELVGNLLARISAEPPAQIEAPKDIIEAEYTDG